MKIEMKFLISLLRLWSLMLPVLLTNQQLIKATTIETRTTAASVTIEPASRENDFKKPKLTTTPSTIHLTQHGIDDDFGSIAEEALENKEEVTFTSPNTLAFSYTPVTIMDQATEAPVIQQAELSKNMKQKINVGITTTQPYQHKHDLEKELKETDLKQATESVVEEKQQQQQQQLSEHLAKEVSWQKETDMHKYSTGYTRNAKNGIKITTTTIAPLSSITTNSAMNIMPLDTTDSKTLAHTTNGKVMDSVATTTEQNKPDHIVLQETAGDKIKFVNEEMKSVKLILAKDKQAMDNFQPVIKDANEKLLKERTIFSNKPKNTIEEWKQNLMPNELQYEDNKPLLAKTYKHNINWSPYLLPATPVTDFTGKLLQEQDGVITEIEQKFRLNEFANIDETKTTNNPDSTTQTTSLDFTQTTTFSKELNPATSHSVNHKILDINKSPILNRSPVEFIERRVKKSFDFPMHRVASDAQHLQQHFDFANTKFSSNNNDQYNIQDTKTNTKGQHKENLQPEFSTTKFYNSKELYNEMLQHKVKKQQQMPHNTDAKSKDIEELNKRTPSLTLNSFAVLHSPKIAKLEEIHQTKEPEQQQKSLSIKMVTVKATKHFDLSSSVEESSKTTARSTGTTSIETTPNTKVVSIKDFSADSLTEMPLAALVKTKKFQKELKRAKLLIKSMMPLQNTTTAAPTTNNSKLKGLKQEKATTILPQQTQILPETKLTSLTEAPLQTTADTSTTSTPNRPTSSFSPQSSVPPSVPRTLPPTSTAPSKTSLHPIVRPRILSRLQEKINSLECELQNLPQDSHLWRGNETHELLLPIMTPENCKDDKDCTAMMVSWEGEAEIQSGDILIVEINDALLTPKDINLTISTHNTQVYQVTRSGHEHCDVTEGILLDITPLIVDGRKLVTLYDKDLTEGVNLLIVVSELWGAQCVRLKVTTKTENCGEAADCSGKGICYSNYDMEEYECECCSGFAGPHCEEIDACTPSPCTNNGICVDLSQGHEGNSYQCLCPYGYTGKNCQYELDPCNSAECLNGGSCIGNSTHFRCECMAGYTGPLCQHSLNECESSPCIHGICVDQEDGFRCFCQPGFAGELCNFEYNECESNPCQNGGECIDHIGSYECHCSKGYTGNRCQIKVDFCANKPCPEGRRCIDHGNEYSCECLGGRNGPDCNELQRTQCNVNPCTHGGTCWSSGDSFYCACRPGYTGTMCEDEFVVETVVSSSEFMVDDTSARNFNDKSFGSSVVLKSPIELHNAYTAAIVLALVIFFVALYLTICHCKINQTYRKFSTRTYGFLPIVGFRLRTKQATSKISRHWLSGKGLGATTSSSSTSALHATTTTTTTTTTSAKRNSIGHLPTTKASSATQQHTHSGQLNERPFQRHLAMNLENDMYYTVDFSENSQHSPLIQ